MRITAMDIDNKEFKRVIRGYCPDEVDEFLDKIAEDYEAVFKDNSVLKEKIEAYEEKIKHYRAIEGTIQNTLLLAQKAADQVKNSAQKEGEMIIKNANDSAQRILDKAHNDVLRINDEYEKMKVEFSKFRAKYRNFMNSQFEMFESLEKDFDDRSNVGKGIKELVSLEKNLDISSEQNNDIDEIGKEKEAALEVEPKNILSNEFRIEDFANGAFSTQDINEIKTFFTNK